jgi:hypothetical protein
MAPPGIMLFVKLIQAGHSVEYRFVSRREPETMLNGFIADIVEVGIQLTVLVFFLGSSFNSFSAVGRFVGFTLGSGPK